MAFQNVLEHHVHVHMVRTLHVVHRCGHAQDPDTSLRCNDRLKAVGAGPTIATPLCTYTCNGHNRVLMSAWFIP